MNIIIIITFTYDGICFLDKCEFSQDVYEVDEGHERIVNLTFTKELSEDIMIPLMYQTNDHITSM